jgi:hypothetical protein
MENLSGKMKGRLVVFLLGQTGMSLSSLESLKYKPIKSSPNYPDVIPSQWSITSFKSVILGQETGIHVKAYQPDILVFEASVQIEDLLSDFVLDLKKDLIAEGQKILNQYNCNMDFCEEYSVYCVSEYKGDPEVFVTTFGDKIVSHLKNERLPLDEEELNSTLSYHLKYARGDMAIVDWDGAFLFDPNGLFEENIELFQTVNLQLLRYRTLDKKLDKRLSATLGFQQGRPGSILQSGKVRDSLLEIMQIRTESILETEQVEYSIKLIGDWYSAKLYSLISKKFHLDTWKGYIDKKLDTIEDIYSMAAENFVISSKNRAEFLLLGGWFILLVGWSILLVIEILTR